MQIKFLPAVHIVPIEQELNTLVIVIFDTSLLDCQYINWTIYTNFEVAIRSLNFKIIRNVSEVLK